MPREVAQAGRIIRYAVVARYPGLAEPVTKAEYAETVAIAEEVVQWAQNVVTSQ